MKLQEYRKLDAPGVTEMVSNKQVTPKELLGCALEMISKTQDKSNAVANFDPKIAERTEHHYCRITVVIKPEFFLDIARKLAYSRSMFGKNLLTGRLVVKAAWPVTAVAEGDSINFILK